MQIFEIVIILLLWSYTLLIVPNIFPWRFSFFQFSKKNLSLSSQGKFGRVVKLENIHNQFIQSEVFLPNFKLTSLSLAHHLFHLITPT